VRILRNGFLPGAFKRAASTLSTVVLAAGLITTGAVATAQANSKYAGIVVDARTGKTLYASSADRLRYPASLTKMMTLYMVFDALERGKITKKTRIRMSKYANGKPPSRIAISTGSSLSVDSAIRSLVTKSANNVAAAIAEHLGGTEANFGRMMTKKARALGMSKTTFRNASGLTAKGQLTTARDMAKLGLALREHFPREYKYFSTRSFKYGKHRYGNHNRLLGRVKGVDGIKTGYTRASGFNLVSSVSTGNRKIVAVVMGGRSGSSRNAQMIKLINRYLPKASRRGGKQLIASRSTVRGRTGDVFGRIARVTLPKTVALPKFHAPVLVAAVSTNAAPKAPKLVAVPQTRASRIDQALVASISTPNAVAKPRYRPTDAPRLLQGRAELAAFMAQAANRNAKPSVNAQAPIVAVSTPTTAAAYAPTAAPSRTEVATAAITTTPKGWHIQIAAVDSTDAASSMHAKAKRAGGNYLKNRTTWTQEIEKNGVNLYRVRFTGFPSKSEARNACKYLKRKKFACLAINQT
jgi:D-alanyl-D-alanine carboxypeptidase